MLSRVDLNKLNTFLVVAEQGGITHAAKKLMLTRSAVSQCIAALEASLDVRLFNRVAQRLVLTPEGASLVESMRPYQSALGKALEQLVNRPDEAQGLVRVGLFIGFSKAKLTDFLASFLSEHDGVQVKILFVSQAELAKLVMENRVDFALSIYPLHREAKSIASTRLFDEELVLVSGKKYFKPRASLREIRALPFVDYYQEGQLARQWIRHHFGKDVGDLNIRAFGAAIDFVLEMILKNVGVGIVPRYVAEPLLERGRLYQIKTGGPELADSIWLNEIRGFHHTAAARVFLARLRASFAD